MPVSSTSVLRAALAVFGAMTGLSLAGKSTGPTIFHNLAEAQDI